MARSIQKGATRARPRTFVAAQVSAQHEVLADRLAKCGLPEAERKEMLSLLQEGGTFVSYDIHPRNDDGSLDETVVLKAIGSGAVWLGHPDAPDAKVVVNLHAQMGPGGNAIRSTRVGQNGREYSVVSGVKPSGWALKQDQADYEAWAKAQGLVATGPKRSDVIPVASATAAAADTPVDDPFA